MGCLLIACAESALDEGMTKTLIHIKALKFSQQIEDVTEARSRRCADRKARYGPPGVSTGKGQNERIFFDFSQSGHRRRRAHERSDVESGNRTVIQASQWKLRIMRDELAELE